MILKSAFICITLIACTLQSALPKVKATISVIEPVSNPHKTSHSKSATLYTADLPSGQLRMIYENNTCIYGKICAQAGVQRIASWEADSYRYTIDGALES